MLKNTNKTNIIIVGIGKNTINLIKNAKNLSILTKYTFKFLFQVIFF